MQTPKHTFNVKPSVYIMEWLLERRAPAPSPFTVSILRITGHWLPILTRLDTHAVAHNLARSTSADDQMTRIDLHGHLIALYRDGELVWLDPIGEGLK